MPSKKMLTLANYHAVTAYLNRRWLFLAWGGSFSAWALPPPAINDHRFPIAAASTWLLPELGQPYSLKGRSPQGTTTQLAQQVMQLANTTRAQGYVTGLSQLAGQQAVYSMTQQLLAVLPKTVLTEIKLPLHKLDQSAVTCLLPLSNDRQDLWFAQLGIKGMKRRLVAHIGLVRRYWDNQQLWGYNVFLDRDLRWHHVRGGLGLEAGRQGLTLSANYYTGITGWKASRVIADQDEQPATGGDIGLRWSPEHFPQWTGQLLYEHYRGGKVRLTAGQPWKKNPWRGVLSVDYTPIPLLTLGVGYQHGSHRTRQLAYKLLLTYHLGLPGRWQMAPINKPTRSYDFLKRQPYLFVNRRYDIVFTYRHQPSITLLLPGTISGEAGQRMPLYPKISSKYPLSHIEWQHSSLTAAGGQISQEGAENYRIQLPPWQTAGSNRYLVRAIAYDSRGQASQPAECQVTVDPAELDPLRSVTTIEPSTLIANGKAQATLVVKARSKRNQPLRNLSALQWQLAIAGVDSSSHLVVDAFKESPQYPGVYSTTLRATTAGSARLTPLYSSQRLPAVTLTLLPGQTERSVPGPKYPEEKKAEGAQEATAPTAHLGHRDKLPVSTPLFDDQQCEIQLAPITQSQRLWQTTVQLTLRDHKQQPVTGKAHQITPKFIPDLLWNQDPLIDSHLEVNELHHSDSFAPFHPKIGGFYESSPGVYRARISSYEEGSAWLQLSIGNQRLSKMASLSMTSRLNMTLKPSYPYGKKLMFVGEKHTVMIHVKTAQGTPPHKAEKIKVGVTSSDSRAVVTGSPAPLDAQGQGMVIVEGQSPINSVQLVGKLSQGDQTIVGETTVSFDTPFSIEKIVNTDNLPGITPLSLAELDTAWEGARFTLQTSGLPGHWAASNPAALIIVDEGQHHVTFEFRKRPHDCITLIGLSAGGLEVIRETFFITHWVTNPSATG